MLPFGPKRKPEPPTTNFCQTVTISPRPIRGQIVEILGHKMPFSYSVAYRGRAPHGGAPRVSLSPLPRAPCTAPHASLGAPLRAPTPRPSETEQNNRSTWASRSLHLCFRHFVAQNQPAPLARTTRQIPN